MNGKNSKLHFVFPLIGLLIFVSCDGGSSFKGSVRDAGGHPIAGAKVTFETPPGDVRREETTSTEGTFSTTFLHSPYKGVRISIIVSKDGYKTHQQEVSAGEYKDFQIILEK